MRSFDRLGFVERFRGRFVVDPFLLYFSIDNIINESMLILINECMRMALESSHYVEIKIHERLFNVKETMMHDTPYKIL